MDPFTKALLAALTILLAIAAISAYMAQHHYHWRVNREIRIARREAKRHDRDRRTI